MTGVQFFGIIVAVLSVVVVITGQFIQGKEKGLVTVVGIMGVFGGVLMFILKHL